MHRYTDQLRKRPAAVWKNAAAEVLDFVYIFAKMLYISRIRNEEIMFILSHLELLDARKFILIDESDKSGT